MEPEKLKDIRLTELTKTRDVLVKSKALIHDKANWTQGFYARDADGQYVSSIGGRATCWCAEGAIRKVSADLGFYTSAGQNLNNAAFSRFGLSTPGVNDGNGHADVMEMFDIAIDSQNSFIAAYGASE